jgi:hypothetical protein
MGRKLRDVARAFLAALVVVLPTSAAHAEPEATEPEATTESRWYGWQTLVVDGGTILVAIPTSGAALLVGYPLGGPIVHWAHGRVETGFADLGIRLGAPIAGALTGIGIYAATGPHHCGNCELADLEVLAAGMLGAFVGAVSAVVIDAAVLAREDVPVDRTKNVAKRDAVRITPTLRPGHGSLTAGVAGTF